MMKPFRPTREQMQAAVQKRLKDVIAPHLKVLFCGINPGLYSAAVGHNFARPGNRFWPVLFAAGFTERLLSPFEERDLLKYGYGITNIASRPTARAEQLTKEELLAGSRLLVQKVLRYKPVCLAIVGITAYRIAFSQAKAAIGLQQHSIGKTRVWVLPNTSGLNANHQMPDLIKHYRKLHEPDACSST